MEVDDASSRILAGLPDVFCPGGSKNMLRDLVEGEKLPTDLLLAKAVIEIPVPPLRARAGDIPLLASHFLNRFARLNGRKLHGLSAVRAALQSGGISEWRDDEIGQPIPSAADVPAIAVRPHRGR